MEKKKKKKNIEAQKKFGKVGQFFFHGWGQKNKKNTVAVKKKGGGHIVP